MISFDLGRYMRMARMGVGRVILPPRACMHDDGFVCMWIGQDSVGELKRKLCSALEVEKEESVELVSRVIGSATAVFSDPTQLIKDCGFEDVPHLTLREIEVGLFMSEVMPR